MEFTIPQLKFGSEAQVPDEGGISVTKEADGAGAWERISPAWIFPETVSVLSTKISVSQA